MFHHIHYGLSIILVFVGIKMMISELYKIPVAYSLGFVGLVLALSVVVSLIWPKEPKPLSVNH